MAESGLGLDEHGGGIENGLTLNRSAPRQGPTGTRGPESNQGPTTGRDPTGTRGPESNQGPTTGRDLTGTRHPSGTQGPAFGRGFTTNEVYIGVATAEGYGEAVGDAGLQQDVGDRAAIAKAIIKDINDRGGIAGRKLVPVFYDYPVTNDWSSAQQAACARWTEDHQVFAVINVVGPPQEDVLLACLKQRRTPIVSDTLNFVRPSSTYSRYAPYLFAPTHPTFERLIPAWIHRIVALGYFNGWNTRDGGPGSTATKVGILSHRSFRGAEFTRVAQQELVRQGQQIAATFELSAPARTDEAQQAVLRFQRAGVTHVVPQDSQIYWFQQAAEAQNYRPRYTVSTNHLPDDLVSLGTPEMQLTGTLGVGYAPTRDVDNSRDPGDVSAAQARCRKVMQDAGQPTTSRGAFRFMVTACDSFNFLTTTVAKGGLSTEGMHSGARAMQSMPPASTFGISFPHGRFDGVSAARDLAYRNSCSCFAYLDRTNHGL